MHPAPVTAPHCRNLPVQAVKTWSSKSGKGEKKESMWQHLRTVFTGRMLLAWLAWALLLWCAGGGGTDGEIRQGMSPSGSKLAAAYQLPAACSRMQPRRLRRRVLRCSSPCSCPAGSPSLPWLLSLQVREVQHGQHRKLRPFCHPPGALAAGAASRCAAASRMPLPAYGRCACACHAYTPGGGPLPSWAHISARPYLQVPLDATEAEIKRAYRKLSLVVRIGLRWAAHGGVALAAWWHGGRRAQTPQAGLMPTAAVAFCSQHAHHLSPMTPVLTSTVVPPHAPPASPFLSSLSTLPPLCSTTPTRTPTPRPTITLQRTLQRWDLPGGRAYLVVAVVWRWNEELVCGGAQPGGAVRAAPPRVQRPTHMLRLHIHTSPASLPPFAPPAQAYKALTDETSRENYLKYGHPDGPQAMTGE